MLQVRDEGAEVVEHLVKTSMRSVTMVVISTLRNLELVVPLRVPRDLGPNH